MKIAIVPALVISATGHYLRADFYCAPGEALRQRAARLRVLAVQHATTAERYEVEARAEVERSRALGIVVVEEE